MHPRVTNTPPRERSRIHEETMTAPETTDFELVSRAARGDEPSFVALYMRYFDRLYDLALCTVQDDERAKDVVQRSFINAWGQLRKGLPPQHVRAWLFTIARNAAIDEVRKVRRGSPRDVAAAEPRSGRSMTDILAADTGADSEVKLVELVLAAVDGLNEKEYTLLHMYVRHELSVDEIALAMDAQPTNVQTVLSQLLDAFELAFEAELLFRCVRHECEELDQVIREAGSSMLDREIREAIHTHAGGCATCERRASSLAKPSMVFAALPIVSPPEGCIETVWQRIHPHLRGNAAGW
jgi:RNA polymerase sigma factor (sigma-70 family)